MSGGMMTIVMVTTMERTTLNVINTEDRTRITTFTMLMLMTMMKDRTRIPNTMTSTMLTMMNAMKMACMLMGMREKRLKRIRAEPSLRAGGQVQG